MPLLDLRTDLKSLKYTGDQPGGGWSGKPYIQTAIPPTNLVLAEPDTLIGSDYLSPIYRIQSTGNLDYPIRGGDVKFNLGSQTFTLSSQIDKSRIKKFFQDKPRGDAFLKKQIGLNLTNPKIETGNSFQAVPNSNIIPGLLENTRIYNKGFNTLTQVGVQGTGFHLPRHGLTPFDYSSKYYKDIVGAQNISDDSSTNRLLILQNLKLNTRFANVGTNINTVNKLGISLNRNLLFQYLGGPGSVYGIGTTTMRRYDDTSRAAKKYSLPVSMTYDTIMAQKLNNTDKTNGKRTTYIQDFRKSPENNVGENKETGYKTREFIYNLTMPGSSDAMNVLTSFAFDNTKAPWELDNPGTKDLIKFVFEAIENNKPSTSWAIFFRAMLSGFTDNHQATINTFKYQGRGEDFYTYQGVSRAISFSFKIAIQSKEEQKPLYTKLNHLISQVYPDYSNGYGVMRAPIIRLTIGDYLYRIAGMLENVNITIDDNAPWDINVDEIGNKSTGKELPQIVNVQCSFKPIQDFLPRRINDTNLNVPFMTDSDKDYLQVQPASKIVGPIDLAQNTNRTNVQAPTNIDTSNALNNLITRINPPNTNS